MRNYGLDILVEKGERCFTGFGLTLNNSKVGFQKSRINSGFSIRCEEIIAKKITKM